MNSNQEHYIEYASRFAEENKCHIWLGGSFLHGGATLFSDVDISILCNVEKLNDFIYGYSKPVYISYTNRPLGILIIIYKDGVAVDLEIVDKIDIIKDGFFHTYDIKACNYTRNEELYKNLCIRNDAPYQASRLFHRSLIKYLSGKKELGVSIANEMLSDSELISETDYKCKFSEFLDSYNKKYQLPVEYYRILKELIKELN